jgi:YHS domain-containing protein
MGKRLLFGVSGTLLVLWVALAAQPSGSAPAAGAPQLLCPVTGHPIHPGAHAPWQGGTVYFCSQQCEAKFKENPGKYAVRANFQLAMSGQARQIACPFTGKPLNPSIATVAVGGLNVGFCCRACQQTAARADEETRLDLIFGNAFRTGYAITASP